MPLRRASRLAARLVAIVATLLTPGEVAAAAAARQVLVLHSYHRGLTWTDNVDEGIAATLDARHRGLEVRVEYMDAKRVAYDTGYDRFAQYLRGKYAPDAFAVIVCSDDDALELLRRHHDQLFPGTPVVFCGVNHSGEAPPATPPWATGVVEAIDIPSTLRAARALDPHLRRVVVVNDRTKTGLANRRILSQVTPEDDLKLELIDDVVMPELQRRLARLGEGDAVLLLTFNRDAQGEVFDYSQSLERVAAPTRVPIYGVWEFFLGEGIVGGMLTSGVEQGRVAAELALQVLGGTTVGAIPVIPHSPNRYMFDYRQLRRFGVDLDRLPAGSVVIERPVSFYEQHKEKVWAVAMAFAVLALLVVVLAFNIVRRIRTEASLRLSEQRFERVFRHNPSWIAIVRLSDGKYVDVNDAFVATTGFTREEVLGKTPVDIGLYANPDDRYELNESFLTHGRLQNQELTFRMKSGELRVFERSGVLIDVARERCIVSLARDVTAKREAEQAQRESEHQKKLRDEAELKMLQAQINPHFLFNAITTIASSLRTDPGGARDLLVKLADFFRKNIAPGGPEATLATELVRCDDYLGIERARFGDRLVVSRAVSDDALECVMPRMTLQPLVENALRHGLLPKLGPGQLVIGAEHRNGDVRVWIRDDGVGMPADRLASLRADLESDRPREGSGVALRNVHARLVATFGAGHGLVVESAPDEGTTVSFAVPAAGGTRGPSAC